jgi:hypothetical protein
MTRKKAITPLGSTTVGLLTILATARLTGNTNKAGAATVLAGGDTILGRRSPGNMSAGRAAPITAGTGAP